MRKQPDHRGILGIDAPHVIVRQIRRAMQDLGKLLLRLTVGGLLVMHGIHKIDDGIEGIVSNVVGHGLPEFVAYGVYVGELLAPALLIVGFFTRIAGLVVAVNMGVAIYLSHAEQVASLGSHGGWAIELPAFYLLGGLCIALLGSGRIAIDGLLRATPGTAGAWGAPRRTRASVPPVPSA